MVDAHLMEDCRVEVIVKPARFSFALMNRSMGLRFQSGPFRQRRARRHLELRIDPPNGLRSRLFSGAPGTTAGPRFPPVSRPVLVSSRRPFMGLSPGWQAEHFSAR